MSRNSKGVSIVIPLLVLIIQLSILYFIKYKNQQIPLSDFSLLNSGNIINLVFTLVLVVGLVFLRFKKNTNLKSSFLNIFTIISSLLVILCFLTLYIKLPPNNIYILEQSLNKFIVGTVFFFYQLFQFIFISVVWLRLFTGKDLISLRVLFNAIIIFIVFLLFAYFYIEIKMNSYSENWNPNESSIAVVLGAAVWSNNQPSPTLASRLDKAAKLYKKEIVKKIQLTGGNAPGELSEAEVAFKYILNKGVDTSDIYIERETTSTTEQIRFIKNTIVASGKFNNIFIVSDQYHLVRIGEISNFYKLKINIAASELELSFDNKLYNKIRESVALIIFWCFAL